MIHPLKTWPELFRDVVTGRKTFEVRKDDRGFADGDVLQLEEFDPVRGAYTGRVAVRRVAYLLRGAEAFGVKRGHVVMGLAPHLEGSIP